MPDNHMSLDEALEYVKTLTEDQQKIFELAFVAGMSKQAQSSVDRAVNGITKHYTAGWNAGLEMAAFKLVQDFSKSFGADTCASWASWLKEQKR
jgi:hypothetical protein